MTLIIFLLFAMGPVHAQHVPNRVRARKSSTAQALSQAFADVAERVAPTTVHVQAEKDRALSAGLQQLMRDYGIPAPVMEGPASRISTGSGVIVRSDGLILTNHHVINGAVDIEVTLHDKRRLPVRVVGSDPRTDVALLQVLSDDPLPAAPIGDSDAVRVGSWVLAVGHPFDFAFSVSAGIVSARGRRNLDPDEIQDYIQTDAAVNPGSSGGPLFNLAGEVIGINTAIYTPVGGAAQNAGISFAIPSNMAWRVATELLETGRVIRAGVGVSARDRDSSSEGTRPGALLTRVRAGSPAAAAGLRRGDVVISVDGESIGGSDDLRGIVQAAGSDRELRLQVERSGVVQAMVCRTVDQQVLGAVDVVVPSDASNWAGMALVPADVEWMARFGVATPAGDEGGEDGSTSDAEIAGMLVLSVEPSSPAERAGVEAGDLITRVQRSQVSTATQLRAAVEGRRTAMVQVWRGHRWMVAALAGL